MPNIDISRKVFNDKYFPYLNNDNRYLIFYGGAGSGKSFFIAQRYVIKLLSKTMCNLLVVRAVANTNKDSTYALLRQVITKWGVDKFFKFNDSELRITCIVTGNEATFKGLDDPEKLKSITFKKGELTDVWIEEASEVSTDSFNQVNIRLRGKGSKKQIVLSFNPINANHWLKKKFFDDEKSTADICHSTYRDNKFLDDEYSKMLESFKDTDPYYYDVYCNGNWGVMGGTIFDANKVNERLNAIAGQKMAQGIMTSTGFQPESNGWIKIYEEPILGHPYVIGGDTAGEGSDYFIAQVIDNSNGKQVATLRAQKLDPDLYAEQVVRLGNWYNKALVSIETNYDLSPIKAVERLGYHKQYVRECQDTYTGKTTPAYGIVTSKLTRPQIISGLVTIVRESVECINDKETLNEMLTFVRNEKGRAEAQHSCHDDCIMALGIAYFTREQQTYKVVKVNEKDLEWTKDMWEDYRRANKEEKEYLRTVWGGPRKKRRFIF